MNQQPSGRAFRPSIQVKRRRNKRDNSVTVYVWWCHGPAAGRAAGGKRITRTGPSPTPKDIRAAITQGRAWAENKRRELMDPDRAPAATLERIGLAEGMMLYLEWLEGDAGHASPVKRCVADLADRVLTDFVRFLGAMHPDIRGWHQVSCQHVSQWAASLIGKSAGTVNNWLSRLQSVLDWAWSRRWMAEEVNLKALRKRTATRTVLIREDADVRYAVAGDDAVAKAAALLALTGLRVDCELLALPRTAFDALTGTITVPEGQAERTKLHGRVLPLGRVGCLTAAGLASSHDGAILVPASVTRDILARRLLPIMPKELRRWFRFALERLEAPEYVIKALMGHRESRVTEAYSPGLARPGPAMQASQLRAWMERVENILFAPQRESRCSP